MAFPVELASEAAFEVSNLIRDFKDNVESGNPTYLRDGNPDSYIGKLNLATARRSCRKWASEGVGKNAGTDAVMDGFCKPYLEDIGQYPGEPAAQSPFTGGQCVGARYRVTSRITFTDNNQVVEGSVNVLGPLGDPVFEENPPGTYTAAINSAGRVGSGSDGCGTIQTTTPELRTIDSVSTGSGRPFEGEIVSVSICPADGSDDCGDPTPSIEPPTPRPDPGPPTPTPIAPGFDVDIDVEFFPDGTFNIKFNFGGEGTEPEDEPVVVPVDPTPETREPGGEPGDPVTGTPGSEEEGEVDEGQVLVGILVEIHSFPPNANILFTPAGTIYKGPYYAYLGVEGRLDLQPEGSVARQTQFYFAPPDSTHWRVSANTGYTTTITPYYKPRIEA